MICINMDMPKNCGCCCFQAFEICSVTGYNILTTYINLFRPAWCPLRKVRDEAAKTICEKGSVRAQFRQQEDEKLARFLWQVQTGLRSAASEEAWLNWLKSDYDED